MPTLGEEYVASASSVKVAPGESHNLEARLQVRRGAIHQIHTCQNRSLLPILMDVLVDGILCLRSPRACSRFGARDPECWIAFCCHRTVIPVLA